MDNFSQQFKDNLENQPLPDFDANDWKAMKQKLEITPIPPTSNYQKLWWALAVLLLLSFLSNWMIFGELRKANEKISLLGNQKDTVIQKEIHYQIDTIYQIINGNQKKEPNNNETAFAKNPPNDASLFFPKTPIYSFQKTSFSQIPSILNQLENGENLNNILGLSINQYSNSQTLNVNKRIEEEALLKEWQSKTLKKLAIRYPKIKYNSSPTLPILNPQPAETNQKKTLLQRLYPLRPKGLAVGGQFGRTYFFKANQTWDYSLNLNVSFSNNLQMWLTGQHLPMSFESHNFDQNLGIPIVNPPNDDFDLDEIKVNKKGLQIDFGMQYFFNTHQKLQPFVGLGFGTTNLYKNEVKYKFENKQIDEEWEDYRQLDNASRNFAVFKAGLSYQLFPRWSGRLEGVYRQNVNSPDHQVPNNIGVRVGVFYNLWKK